jgi:predicted DNA-binding transcriptional regulator
MANDRTIGVAIFGGSIIGIIIYGVLLYLPWAWEWTLRITAFLAVAVLLGILAWIGYTMATTPPPEPITDIPDTSQPKAEEPAETSKSKAKSK